MKNKEQKIVRLLEEGFSYDTIKKMNDYHLNKIYKNLVSEAVVRVPADKFDSIKDDLDDTDTVEVTEDDVDNIHPFKGQQTQDPKQVGPSTNDGDDNYQDGMANEEFYGSIDEDAVIEELFGKPKMKTPITTLGMFEENNEYAICMDSIQGKYGPKKNWDTKAESKFDACVSKVGKEIKESKIRQIEESIVSLIKKSQGKMITKGDLLSEEPSTAPTRVKPGTKERPSRTTPYRRPNPGPSPKPKAGDESGLPEFLKFSNLNIQFRDE
jgi:hypothetical protein